MENIICTMDDVRGYVLGSLHFTTPSAISLVSDPLVMKI